MSHHFGSQYVEKLLTSHASVVPVPASVSPTLSPSPGPMTSSNFLLQKQQQCNYMGISCSISNNTHTIVNRTESLSPSSFNNIITTQGGIRYGIRPVCEANDLTLDAIPTVICSASNVKKEENDCNNHETDFSPSNIAYKHRLDILLPKSLVPSTLASIKDEYSATICSSISNPDFSSPSTSVSDDHLISNQNLLQKQ